jgi:metallo-beta-lactamase family protein
MIRWHFLGGADTVTGSKHLLDVDGARTLVDFGMFQGRRAESEALNRAIPVDPRSIDAVVLSHAHIDHCGCLPLLVKGGFTGPIHTTRATAELVEIMLRDSARIQEADAAYLNQKTSRQGLPPVDPLYTAKEAEAVLPLLVPHDYHEEIALPGGVKALQFDAGHVLGSALTRLEIPRAGREPLVLALAFDLGRRGVPLLNDPEPVGPADVLVSETTYGNRLHTPASEARQELGEAISAALARGGKVIIPSFALERTQELVYHLSKLRETGAIPPVPVYIDSPMSVAITRVFERNVGLLDGEAKALHAEKGQVVTPPFIRMIETIEDSKAITSSTEPSITLSASGMCENGRIRHHLKHGIENPANMVLLVGFQAVNTLGRKLQNGEKRVRIFGDEFKVAAEIRTLGAFSAHADKIELYRYAREVRPKVAYLVHGEEKSRKAFSQLLRTQLKVETHCPFRGETADLTDI